MSDSQTVITIRLINNGYLITGQAVPGMEPEQWAAHTVDEVCAVLHQILAKPEAE